MQMSRVQEVALDFLLIQEAKEKSEQDFRTTKLAILGADPVKWGPVMFPEWESSRERVEDVSQRDLEDTSGDWEFEEPIEGPEAESLLASLASGMGTMSVQDIDRIAP